MKNMTINPGETHSYQIDYEFKNTGSINDSNKLFYARLDVVVLK